MSVYIPKGKGGEPKSPYYHFDFMLKPAGKPKSERFCGSTGQKTKKAAERVEDKLRELAALGRLGSLMTMAEACDRYLKEKAPQLTPKPPGVIEPMEITAKRQARRQQELCMTELLTYYGEETPIIALTSDDVAKAVTRRAATEIVRWKKVDGELLPIPTGKLPKPATVNRQVVAPLRRVLRRARIQWKVPVDLGQFQWGGEDGVMLEEPEERNRELTTIEEVAFWDALPADYHLICEMYIISGKRQSAWLLLPKDRIDRPGGRVYMRKLKKRREEWHWVELTEREREIVEEAWEQDPDCPYLFTAVSQSDRDRKRRVPITKRMLYDNVRLAIGVAGIKDFHPHDFRHTFGSRAARAPGSNMKVLQRSLDHSSPRSTFRYINVVQDEVTGLRSTVRVTRTLPANVRPLKRGGLK